MKITASLQWKEKMVVEFDGHKLCFEAPMGVTPVTVFLPSKEKWATAVPDWARDKREQILKEIIAAPGVKEVVDDISAQVWEE